MTPTACCRPRILLQCSRDSRSFSSSTRCLVNPLQNLSHFSAAKEAQFLSREKRIPREEFHPYLQLIRSSEVDPFAPIPGASPSVVAALKHAKTGEADTDTALRLAVSNLIDQVQASRQETASVLRALTQVQERYKREERNALLMLFAALGVLGFVMVKTRAMQDLLEYAGVVRREWDKFDWQDLGNSSCHHRHAQSMDLIPRRQRMEKPNVTPASSIPTSEVTPMTTTEPVVVRHVTYKQPEGKSSLSRLFWAAPDSSRT